MMDMNYVPLAGIIPLLVVICFFVFVFVIGRRSRWLAAAVFLGTILAMILLSLSYVRMESHVVQPHRQQISDSFIQGPDWQDVELEDDEHPTTHTRPESDRQTPPAWLPEVDELYIPDRYASMDAAARDFARNVEPLIYRVLSEEPNDDAHPTEIKVYGELFDEGSQLVPTMVNSLQEAYPEIDVSHDADRMSRSDADSIADDNIYIEVKKLIREHVEAPWDQEQLVATGSFETNVYGRAGHAKTSLRFLEKPWVVDFDEFRKRHSRRDQRLILSPEFGLDQHDAQMQCEKLAVAMLTPIVKDKAGALVFGKPDFDMEDELPDAVRDGTFVRDQFAQQLQTPNGPVWRHAMLLDFRDTEPFMTSALAKHRTMEKATIEIKRADDRRRSFRFGGVIALLASVCGIHLVLDTITKGYFAGHVRAILAVFGLVGLMLILLVT